MSQAGQLLVVDDEPDLLDILGEALTDSGFGVEKASSLDQAKVALDTKKFGLVICDISLGTNRRGGLQVLDQAGDKLVPVILISGNADYEVLKLAINKGARFFLEKPFDLSILAKMVREAISPKGDIQKKIGGMSSQFELTAREREVFEFLARGLSNKEIASSLGTSERTVKAHLSSIFKKCNVESRSELLSSLLA